jgi:hypothetical protein
MVSAGTKSGKIRYPEDITEGLAQAPTAFMGMDRARLRAVRQSLEQRLTSHAGADVRRQRLSDTSDLSTGPETQASIADFWRGVIAAQQASELSHQPALFEFGTGFLPPETCAPKGA